MSHLKESELHFSKYIYICICVYTTHVINLSLFFVLRHKCKIVNGISFLSRNYKSLLSNGEPCGGGDLARVDWSRRARFRLSRRSFLVNRYKVVGATRKRRRNYQRYRCVCQSSRYRDIAIVPLPRARRESFVRRGSRFPRGKPDRRETGQGDAGQSVPFSLVFPKSIRRGWSFFSGVRRKGKQLAATYWRRAEDARMARDFSQVSHRDDL